MKGRTLEQLRSQYVSNVKKTDKAIRAVPGMRGPGPHGRGAVSGKPKNAAKVIGRLYIYIKPHSLKLFLCSSVYAFQHAYISCRLIYACSDYK